MNRRKILSWLGGGSAATILPQLASANTSKASGNKFYKTFTGKRDGYIESPRLMLEFTGKA